MSSSNESNSDKDEKKEEQSESSTHVHSANAWEKADLGDDDRRQKFLRLMGASKKEHSGRFVIGDRDKTGTHGREKSQTDELNKDLEHQFVHSQEHKITRWNHSGLGFSDRPAWDRPSPWDNLDKNRPAGDQMCGPAEKPAADSGSADKAGAGDKSGAADKAGAGDKSGAADKAGAVDKAGADKEERKRESTEGQNEEQAPPKKPKMMMSFVKASDS